MGSPDVAAERKGALGALFGTLNPAALHRQILRCQEDLLRCARARGVAGGAGAAAAAPGPEGANAS